MKLKDLISSGVMIVPPKARPEARLLACGKHYGVRVGNESTHCHKCASKKLSASRRPKWHMVGNYAKNTKGDVPSKRNVKDRAKRCMDLWDNLRS